MRDFEGLDIINSTIDDLKDVAVSVTSGQIGFKVELDEVYPKLSFVIANEDIFPDTESVNEGITIEIGFKIIQKSSPDNDFEFNWELVEVADVSTGIILIILACIAARTYCLIPGLITADA